jgi:hypothetical protein
MLIVKMKLSKIGNPCKQDNIPHMKITDAKNMTKFLFWGISLSSSLFIIIPITE